MSVMWLVLIALVTQGVVLAQPDQDSTPKDSGKTESSRDDAEEELTPLPLGYVPPADPPESMLLEKNLLTPEERTQYAKELNKNYKSRMRNGDLRSEDSQAAVRNGIRYRLNELTIAKNKPELSKHRLELSYQDLRQAGTAAGFNFEQLRTFRREFLQMIVDETEPLFQNNYYSRIQAAILLGELNWMEEDYPRGTRNPVEAFPPAGKLLAKVVLDPDQPEAVKIAAVLSMIRIVRHSSPNVEENRDIATAAVSELKRTDSFYWYQERLAELLGQVNITRNLDGETFIFDVLRSVLKDSDRNIQVRVQAAWSLARHPLMPAGEAPQVMNDVAALGLEFAQLHAEDPEAPYWKRLAFMLYLTFQPENANDKDASRQRPGGFLNHPSTRDLSKEVYQQLLKIIVPILNDQKVTDEEIQNLGKWMESRSPKPSDTNLGKTEK